MTLKNLFSVTFLIALCGLAPAQLSFSNSGNNIPANFVAQGLGTVSPTEIYAVGAIHNSGWTPKVYKSTDGGINWANISVTGINISQEFYNTFCFTGTKMIMASQDGAATNTGMFSSTDGSNWTMANSGIPANFVAQDLFCTSPSEVYAIGAVNNSGWTPKIYKSTDGSATWSDVTVNGISATQIFYNTLCKAGNKWILATQDGQANNTGVFSSTDGTNWIVSNTGIPANFVTKDLLAISPSEIYAVGAIDVTGSGWTPKIYKSIDSGTSWTAVSVSGINASQDFYIAVCLAGNKLLMASQDGPAVDAGIFSTIVASSSTITTGIADQTTDRNVFFFPNPVTDVMTIKSTENIEAISIIDLKGETVFKKTYTTELKNEIKLDLGDYKKGLYFMNVNYSSYKKSTKILVQ